MLNKYGERTQPCRTPFLTGNHSDSVPATLTLASCFLMDASHGRCVTWWMYHMVGVSGGGCTTWIMW